MTDDAMRPLADAQILVTGAAGFIGSHVCEQLCAAGATVTALDDLSNGDRSNLQGDALRTLRFVEGDAGDRPLLASLLSRTQAVVHLAALVSVQQSFDEPVEGFRRNAAVGAVVFSEAARLRVPAIYASSAAVYGASLDLPLKETAAPDPLSPYAADKLYLEYTARAWRARGLRSIGLRLFNVYGPRQRADSPYSGVISKFSARLAAAQTCAIYGDGEQTRDFVHVTDVARCFSHGVQSLLQSAAEGAASVFNCGTGTSVSINHLHAVMARLHGRGDRASRLPATTGDVRHSLADISAVRSAIAWSPRIPLEEGLQALVRAP